MLGGVICSRPKSNWFLPSFSISPYPHPRRLSPSFSLLPSTPRPHSSACGPRAASIWHVIQPSGGTWGVLHGTCGEGSWNVGWDVRPARWLHRPDSGWMLFGVCACLTVAPVDDIDAASDRYVAGNGDKIRTKAKYLVTGRNLALASKVLHSCFRSLIVICESVEKGDKAQGIPILFTVVTAIAHVACLRNGEEAPDENRQRELADDLRAQVVDELVKRRKEIEWFIEEEFDTYVNRIRQPYVWGGKPELLMSSHVLKTPISVFEVDKSSGNLTKIADYGEEYQKDEKNPINVLFHRYGHYDI